MIDIENAKVEFLNYVKQYDINSGRIKLKVKHILKVAENSKMIAQNLGLDDEQIKLAELIGLFHDIGRFEQVKLYDTFSDKESNLNHAEYSLKILYEDGLIKRFINTDKYDDIIKEAVYNHNRPKIESFVTGDALLYSKIIRDADKLDIYRVINEEEIEDIFWYKEFQGLDMSEELMEEFSKNNFVNYNDIRNNADQIYAFFGYLFDFNFNICLEIIKQKEYLEKFAKRVKKAFDNKKISEKIDKIVNICNNYIEERIKEA